MKMTRTFLFQLSCLIVGISMLAPSVAGRLWAQSQDSSTLILTWSGDPTTTMDALWLTAGQLPALIKGQAAQAAQSIPKLQGIVIDGQSGDWQGQGLEIALFGNAKDIAPAPESLKAQVRIGWMPQGLAVWVKVEDDHASESSKDDALWAGDGIELFLTDAKGEKPYQLIIAPGVDKAHPQMRTLFFDRREKDALPLKPIVARSLHKKGYCIEALLPWPNLMSDGTAPAQVRFQIYVNDRDLESKRSKMVWYPSETSHNAYLDTFLLKLDTSAQTSALSLVRGQLSKTKSHYVLNVSAPVDQAANVVDVYATKKQVGQITLVQKNGVAKGELKLKIPKNDLRWGALSLVIDKKLVGVAEGQNYLWAKPPKPVTVHYKRADGKEERHTLQTKVTAFGNTGDYIQRVNLTGLLPDTKYILNLPADPTAYLFKTAPKTQTKPIVFAEGGDIGTAKVVADLHQLVASWDPLMGVIGGDLAYANGISLKLWHRFFRDWHTHMRGINQRMIPMVVTIGNHEVIGGRSFGDLSKAPLFYSLFGSHFEKGSYGTLDFGNYLSLILLDTHTTKVNDQTPWLEKTLAQRQHVPHVFPLYHVPAYPSHRGATSDDYRGLIRRDIRKYWVPLFDQYGIRVSFEHDDHTYKRTHPLRNNEIHEEGVVYLGDGAWGREPRKVSEGRPYIAVSKSSLNVFKVTLDGHQASFHAYDEKGILLDQYQYPRQMQLAPLEDAKVPK